MKKALILIMTLIMLVSVVGCVDKVSETEELIEKVRYCCDMTENTTLAGNTINAIDEELDAAEKAYNSLSEEDKAKVENADILPEARKAFNKARNGTINNVIDNSSFTDEEKEALKYGIDIY